MMNKKTIQKTVLPSLLVLMMTLAGCAGMDESAGVKDQTAAELAGLGQEAVPNAFAELTPEQAKDPKALEAKADSLVVHDDLNSALYLYQKAIPLAAEPVQIRLNTKMGFVHLREGRYRIAYNLLLPLPKNNAIANQIWLGLGLAQMSLDQIDQAEASLQKSLKTGQASWKAYNAMGVIYNKHKKPQEALEMFDQALRLRPEIPALYNNRGLSYMMLGNYKDAESSFWQALKLDSDYKLARNNLALLYSSQKRWDEARTAFNRSVGEAKAHNNVGVLMAHDGEYLGAREQFRLAVEKLPTYYTLADRNLEDVKNMARSEITKPAGEDLPKPAPKKAKLTSKPPEADQAKTAPDAAEQNDIKVQLVGAAPGSDDGDGQTANVVAQQAVAVEKPQKSEAAPESQPVHKTESPEKSAYIYHVQIASLRDFARAQTLMNDYMAKGYSCQLDIWTSKKGQRWFRLLLGPYTSKTLMDSALGELTHKEGITDYKVIRRQAG